MTYKYRKAKKEDLPFFEEMLYEAVFWRENPNKPSFDEALKDPNFIKAVKGVGEKLVSVVAYLDDTLVGAAWLSYWTEDNQIRGYIEEDVPVLVIGVHENFRGKGIGEELIQWLFNHSESKQISLCVSKDNYAMRLYKKTGFTLYEDIGDSLLMVRELYE